VRRKGKGREGKRGARRKGVSKQRKEETGGSYLTWKGKEREGAKRKGRKQGEVELCIVFFFASPDSFLLNTKAVGPQLWVHSPKRKAKGRNKFQ
jgi:hypothetical protein